MASSNAAPTTLASALLTALKIYGLYKKGSSLANLIFSGNTSPFSSGTLPSGGSAEEGLSTVPEMETVPGTELA
jgi:hypothetical protein